MSGIDHVDQEILKPMQALFLPPRQQMEGDALREALRGYAIALRPFGAADLRAAWTEVVATHMTRSWPVPGVIVLAARKAQKERGGDENARTKAKYGNVDPKARWNTWLVVRASQMARDAADAGCSWSLKCLVLNDGKGPGEINLAELIRAHASAVETADAIAERSPVLYEGRWIRHDEPKRKLALEMWANQLKSESETADEIMRAAPLAKRTEAA